MEIKDFIQKFGDKDVIEILSNVPEIVQMYPKSAAYSTSLRNYILTHVSEKKPDEIYLRELMQYAESKNLKIKPITAKK